MCPALDPAGHATSLDRDCAWTRPHYPADFPSIPSPHRPPTSCGPGGPARPRPHAARHRQSNHRDRLTSTKWPQSIPPECPCTAPARRSTLSHTPTSLSRLRQQSRQNQLYLSFFHHSSLDIIVREPAKYLRPRAFELVRYLSFIIGRRGCLLPSHDCFYVWRRRQRAGNRTRKDGKCFYHGGGGTLKTPLLLLVLFCPVRLRT